MRPEDIDKRPTLISEVLVSRQSSDKLIAYSALLDMRQRALVSLLVSGEPITAERFIEKASEVMARDSTALNMAFSSAADAWKRDFGEWLEDDLKRPEGNTVVEPQPDP
jgi:hypothetical protein